jgi:uncharacterized membrane protein
MGQGIRSQPVPDGRLTMNKQQIKTIAVGVFGGALMGYVIAGPQMAFVGAVVGYIAGATKEGL